MPTVSNLYCTVVKATRKHKLIISQYCISKLQVHITLNMKITSMFCTAIMLSLLTHHKILNIELIWLFIINLHLNLHNSSANHSLFNNKKWKGMLTMLYIYILKKAINRLHTFRKTTATRSFTALYYFVLGSLPPQKFAKSVC